MLQSDERDERIYQVGTSKRTKILSSERCRQKPNMQMSEKRKKDSCLMILRKDLDG